MTNSVHQPEDARLWVASRQGVDSLWPARHRESSRLFLQPLPKQMFRRKKDKRSFLLLEASSSRPEKADLSLQASFPWVPGCLSGVFKWIVIAYSFDCVSVLLLFTIFSRVLIWSFLAFVYSLLLALNSLNYVRGTQLVLERCGMCVCKSRGKNSIIPQEGPPFDPSLMTLWVFWFRVRYK